MAYDGMDTFGPYNITFSGKVTKRTLSKNSGVTQAQNQTLVAIAVVGWTVAAIAIVTAGVLSVVCRFVFMI